MSMFLTVANTLAIFDIRREVDQNGVEIVPEVRYTGATIRYVTMSPLSEMGAELWFQWPTSFPFQGDTAV